MHVYVYVRICECVKMCVCSNVYPCACVCMYVCMHVVIHLSWLLVARKMTNNVLMMHVINVYNLFIISQEFIQIMKARELEMAANSHFAYQRKHDGRSASRRRSLLCDHNLRQGQKMARIYVMIKYD